jgi:hypothetical protein
MHAMDSTQAMRLRAVVRRPRLVTARVRRGFMASPSRSREILIPGFGVPTMRDEELNWNG